MCEIIKSNPKAVIEVFDFFCETVYEYPDAPADLQQTFRVILTSFKENSGESWPAFFSAFSPEMQQSLSNLFGV